MGASGARAPPGTPSACQCSDGLVRAAPIAVSSAPVPLRDPKEGNAVGGATGRGRGANEREARQQGSGEPGEAAGQQASGVAAHMLKAATSPPRPTAMPRVLEASQTARAGAPISSVPPNPSHSPSATVAITAGSAAAAPGVGVLHRRKTPPRVSVNAQSWPSSRTNLIAEIASYSGTCRPTGSPIVPATISLPATSKLPKRDRSSRSCGARPEGQSEWPGLASAMGWLGSGRRRWRRCLAARPREANLPGPARLHGWPCRYGRGRGRGRWATSHRELGCHDALRGLPQVHVQADTDCVGAVAAEEQRRAPCARADLLRVHFEGRCDRHANRCANRLRCRRSALRRRLEPRRAADDGTLDERRVGRCAETHLVDEHTARRRVHHHRNEECVVVQLCKAHRWQQVVWEADTAFGIDDGDAGQQRGLA